MKNNYLLKLIVLLVVIVYCIYLPLNWYSVIFNDKEIGYSNTILIFGVVGILAYLKIIHDKIR